jgi:hypothetical protein
LLSKIPTNQRFSHLPNPAADRSARASRQILREKDHNLNITADRFRGRFGVVITLTRNR